MISAFIFMLCSIFKNDDNIILFNKYPITQETILNNSIEFPRGEKIYYIFLSKKVIKAKIIQVRVVKKDTKVEFWGVSPVFENYYKVCDDEIKYYTNYLVLHDKGYYVMQVFDRKNLNKPLASGDFWVR